MLRRFRAAWPTRQSLTDTFSFRPNDRNAIFIITNNTPQQVNRIQVQSACDEIEPERERGGSPSVNCQKSWNMFANCLRRTAAQNQEVNVPPQPVESEFPNDNRQSQGHTSLQIEGGNDCSNEFVIISRSGRHRTQNDVEDELEDMEENTEPTRNNRTTGPIAVPRQIELHSIPTFLKVHFDIMFYTGISPINGDGERGSPLQLVAFGIVTLLAMLFAFARLKQFIVDQAKTGDLQDYISAWYFISSHVLQLAFLWLVVFRFREVSDILKEAKANQAGIRYKVNQRNANISVLSVTFASLGIAQALIETLKLDLLLTDHIVSMEEYILSHSHGASLLCCLWSKETNGTDTYEILYRQYGKDLTPTTMSMGILGMTLTFFGYLHEIAIKDLLLMTALQTYRLSQIFQSNMKQVSQEKPASDQLTSLLSNIHSQLSNITEKIESCFGNFFKLVHADNLLYWAYMLSYFHFLKGEVGGTTMFHGTVNLLKITCILYFPLHAIKTVKGVIRKKYTAYNSARDMTVVALQNVILLLQTLEENPLAIGSDNFLMDETFSRKFIGAVVTFFLFLVDADKAAQRRRRR